MPKKIGTHSTGSRVLEQRDNDAEILHNRFMLGDQLVQALQIMPSLIRILLRSPWSELLRGLRIEWPGLYFEQNRLIAERHDGMPRSWRQFDAWRNIAEQLSTEQDDPLWSSIIVEQDKRKLPFYRKQCFGFGVQRMPVWTNIALGSYRVEQALTGILIALVNIQVLSLPRRLLRRASQVF